MRPQSIVLLGAGRLAQHLAPALSDLEGYELTHIYNRSIEKAEALASKLSTLPKITDSIKTLPQEADIYIFALSDTALEEVFGAMPPTSGLWLHTAGSVLLSLLEKYHQPSGVLYPLQSFSSEKDLSWASIPLYIEASDTDTLKQVERLAQALSREVHLLNSTARGRLHLSAVLANNFTNHLIALAEDLLIAEGLSPKSLLPLIEETCEKLRHLPAREAQTGPALRGDERTIKRHLDLLENNPSLQKLYLELSSSIQRMYHSHHK